MGTVDLDTWGKCLKQSSESYEECLPLVFCLPKNLINVLLNNILAQINVYFHKF